MNLIITCQRNLEDPTILEARNMLERFGDVDAIIEKGHTIVELERSGLEKDLVNSIYKKIRMSEYKRRQAAPGLRVSTKAFGIGRRFPLVNHFER